MTDVSKPRLFDRLRLPANVVDTTERSIGKITGVVGYEGIKRDDDPRPGRPADH
jgi:hypothetical protein